MARDQDQFLNVLDRDEAERRWWDAVRPVPLGLETVALSDSLGRVLGDDVTTEFDVPAFDRSNVDGFALRSEETFGASEDTPLRIQLNDEEIITGIVPRTAVTPGTASAIATGGMLPRGADAVLMVEDAQVHANTLSVTRPVAPGSNVSFAGTDMARGELVLLRGTRLTARETGVLAAIGRAAVAVVRRPRVAIVSTGDEILAPGEPTRPASVHDANATLIADAVRELGGEPIVLGIVPDDEGLLDAALDRGLDRGDVVVLSGGTSKGGGDVSYRVLAGRAPGVVVHGVALKPGKPVCLGAVGAAPVAILPGFPTSAIFTFHAFVAPVLRMLGGLGPEARETLPARMALRANSERGRTEYLLVNLIGGQTCWTAYPLGKGSGSVTTFSRADGFVVIPKDQEYLEAGEAVGVTLLGRGIEPADLIAIGSHCVGLDAILGLLSGQGLRSKTFWVGSQGGLTAAGRGECDIAGVHLLDPVTNRYNQAFLPDNVRLVRGYDRMQGLVYRPGDSRFEGKAVEQAIVDALGDPSCVMVNRNRGSGTRVLIDRLLEGRKPRGLAVEVRSHNAVAASVSQGRADWGLAIGPVARMYGLAFTPVRVEHYDFAIPAARWDRPAVAAFRSLLTEPGTRRRLEELGFSMREGDP
jgi:putative molybdopterin biosynthesis protein